jgi:hypothetical protein
MLRCSKVGWEAPPFLNATASPRCARLANHWLMVATVKGSPPSQRPSRIGGVVSAMDS